MGPPSVRLLLVLLPLAGSLLLRMPAVPRVAPVVAVERVAGPRTSIGPSPEDLSDEVMLSIGARINCVKAPPLWPNALRTARL